MTDANFALREHGAQIVDVSHEAAHVASAASNLLTEREDFLWITGEAPQHVVIRISENHPPIRYAGWHVWHDYLTNPKTVEVASGVARDCLSPVLICTALPGAGTQLWELPTPIPPTHVFIRFMVLSTFAPGPTYMNHLALYAEHPGSRFSTRAVESSAPQSTSRQIPISSLLRELDEDIRSLQPIKTISPSKNLLVYVPPDRRIDDEDRLPLEPRPRSPQGARSNETSRVHGKSGELASDFGQRLANVEEVVAQLTCTIDRQREDIATIKRLLTIQQRDSDRLHAELVESRYKKPQTLNVEFPEDALKSFVEDVLAPKLSKHAKRVESRTMDRVDEHLRGLIGRVHRIVDDVVSERLGSGATLLDCAPVPRFDMNRSSSDHSVPRAKHGDGSVEVSMHSGGPGGRRRQDRV